MIRRSMIRFMLVLGDGQINGIGLLRCLGRFMLLKIFEADGNGSIGRLRLL